MNKPRKPPPPSGAYGNTVVVLTPQQRKGLTVDVRNCPHCGVHHASLDAVVVRGGRVVMEEMRAEVECPSLRRKIVFTIKFFLHPV